MLTIMEFFVVWIRKDYEYVAESENWRSCNDALHCIYVEEQRKKGSIRKTNG